MKKKVNLNYNGVVRGTALNVAGGVLASVIDTKITSQTTNMLVKGAIAVGLPMFVKNMDVKNACEGVAGALGYQLGTVYVAPKLAGLGLLPTVRAIGNSGNWVASRVASANTMQQGASAVGANEIVAKKIASVG
jgi:hypothetical protein